MFRFSPSGLVIGLFALNSPAADPVTVKGSSAKYPPAVSITVGEKAVRLNLTGVGPRTKLGFGIYAIAGYSEDGPRVRTAEELLKVDAIRALHLVMERDVEP